MTSSVPDSISFDELNSILEERHERDAISDFQEHCCQVAQDALDEAIAHIPDPMVHKLMALLCIRNLARYHDALAETTFDTAGLEAADVANAWTRDCGRLHAAYDLLRTVVLGDNDFTAE